MEKLPASTISMSTAAANIGMKQNNSWNEESSSGTKIADSQGENDQPFDFSAQGTCGLDWVKTFLQLEEDV